MISFRDSMNPTKSVAGLLNHRWGPISRSRRWSTRLPTGGEYWQRKLVLPPLPDTRLQPTVGSHRRDKIAQVSVSAKKWGPNGARSTRVLATWFIEYMKWSSSDHWSMSSSTVYFNRQLLFKTHPHYTSRYTFLLLRSVFMGPRFSTCWMQGIYAHYPMHPISHPITDAGKSWPVPKSIFGNFFVSAVHSTGNSDTYLIEQSL